MILYVPNAHSNVAAANIENSCFSLTREASGESETFKQERDEGDGEKLKV